MWQLGLMFKRKVEWKLGVSREEGGWNKMSSLFIYYSMENL